MEALQGSGRRPAGRRPARREAAIAAAALAVALGLVITVLMLPGSGGRPAIGVSASPGVTAGP